MSNRAILANLWWAMHHSDDEHHQSAAVTCYLDDSGSHAGSVQAVVGGLVLNRSAFLAFCEEWDELTLKHCAPSIHMKDFLRPHGKLSHISNTGRCTLLSEAVGIINSYKSLSLASVIWDSSHKQAPEEIQKAMRTSGFCYLQCVSMQHKAASSQNYRLPVAFVFDTGCQHANDILNSHQEIKTRQRAGEFFHAGSLTFEDDEIMLPLQASDMVAWGTRRKATIGLYDGFEPLEDIFKYGHWREEVKGDDVRVISDGIPKRLNSEVPKK